MTRAVNAELLKGHDDVLVEHIEGYLNGDALDEAVLNIVEEVNPSNGNLQLVGVEATGLHAGGDVEGIAHVHVASPAGPVLSP